MNMIYGGEDEGDREVEEGAGLMSEGDAWKMNSVKRR